MDIIINWGPAIAYCDECKSEADTKAELSWLPLSKSSAIFISQYGWHCASCQAAAAAAEAKADCYA